MDPKQIKLHLMAMAAALAGHIVDQLADDLPVDSKVEDAAVQKVVQLGVKLTEEFYPYLLAAWQSGGKNPDGSPNAFADPQTSAVMPPPPASLARTK